MELAGNKWVIGGVAIAALALGVLMLRRPAPAADDGGAGLGYIGTTLPIVGGSYATGGSNAQPVEAGTTVADAISEQSAAMLDARRDLARVDTIAGAAESALAQLPALVTGRRGGQSRIRQNIRFLDGTDPVTGAATARAQLLADTRINVRGMDIRALRVANRGVTGGALNLPPINVKTKVDGGLF